MTPQSLTGDPEMDRLVPVVMQLVGAVRAMDPAGVDEAFDAARRLIPDEEVAGGALCVLLAAMVPWDRSPSQLLAWWVRRADYQKLIAAGVDPATAMTLIEGGAEWAQHPTTNDPGSFGSADLGGDGNP